MENLKTDKRINVLKWIFILLTVIHIIYATITMRGMYMDGCFFMLDLLNKFDRHIYSVTYDAEHCRLFLYTLIQAPVILSQFFIKNKFALMMIFSFSQIGIPFIVLYLNYLLTKRTGKIDVFFWNLFFYSALILLYMIFSLVETIIGFTLNFILWNYLVSDINYKKRDVLFIIILLIIMFSTYEYVSYVGLIFFAAHFLYVKREKIRENRIIKRIIGYGALFASLYNIFFIFNNQDENSEILRCWMEVVNILKWFFTLNISITLLTIILLIFAVFKKTKLSNISFTIIICLYLGIFCKMMNNLQLSLIPMLEGHFRIIACMLIPFPFIIMFLRDAVNKNKGYDYIKFSNCTLMVLLCGIFLTCWQIVNTYFWDVNIKYMKKELSIEQGLLYIPIRHDEISTFFNNKLRRYIWHSSYAAMSILFSDTYKQKTLLVNYDNPYEDANFPAREHLYVYKHDKNIMSIPDVIQTNVKNRFWDLTECAQALDKYNKDNNIPTHN